MATSRSLVGSKRCWAILTSVFDNRLVMPPVFNDHCNGDIPTSINLITGQGVWDFDVITDGGNIYLGNGWADFRDACHMSLFDMIVFAFDNPSIINVALFKADGRENDCNFTGDESPTAILRDLSSNKGKLLSGSETMVLETIGIVGRKRPYSEINKSGTVCGSEKVKAERNDGAGTSLDLTFNNVLDVLNGRHEGSESEMKDLMNNKIDDEDEDALFVKKSRASNGTSSTDTYSSDASDAGEGDEDSGFPYEVDVVLTQNPNVAEQTNVNRERTNVISRTSHGISGLVGRISGNHCEITLSKDDMCGRFFLELPIIFSKATLRMGYNERTLDVVGGQRWPVTCQLAPLRCRIVQGWLTFVSCNRLKEGDTMVFIEDPTDKTFWMVLLMK